MAAMDLATHGTACDGYTRAHDFARRSWTPVTSLSADDALLTDEALAHGFADRDVRALEIAYDRHARAVFSLALKLLGDPEAAEEIVQETFLKLWHRPETYVPMRGRLVTWLLGVAHHRSVDRLRRRRLEQRHGTDARLAETGVDHHDPLDDVLSTLRGEAVARALATLPAAQRLAVELAYLKGMTQVEIAEHLGEPLGTIKTRLRLAMQKLRGSLELAEMRP
jgi:RNA polymerase sigma-70 factor (ECF subfamily)